MAALQGEFLAQNGEIPVQLSAARFIPDRLQPLVDAAGDAVEDETADVALLAEMQKALQLREDGEGTAPPVHDEHGGCIQLSADFVGAVLAREAHAVVIAHRALDEVDLARRIGEHGGEILAAEKAV